MALCTSDIQYTYLYIRLEYSTIFITAILCTAILCSGSRGVQFICLKKQVNIDNLFFKKYEKKELFFSNQSLNYMFQF